MPRYFAYGSNMDSAQMASRVPAARTLGRARLVGYLFICNKIGRDGSAKANVLSAAGEAVWGAVYDITDEGLSVLDHFEGGYRRQAVRVRLGDGSETECTVYVSELTSTELRPTRAYRDRMVHGAREHDLPPEWHAMLGALAVSD